MVGTADYSEAKERGVVGKELLGFPSLSLWFQCAMDLREGADYWVRNHTCSGKSAWIQILTP